MGLISFLVGRKCCLLDADSSPFSLEREQLAGHSQWPRRELNSVASLKQARSPRHEVLRGPWVRWCTETIEHSAGGEADEGGQLEPGIDRAEIPESSIVCR